MCPSALRCSLDVGRTVGEIDKRLAAAQKALAEANRELGEARKAVDKAQGEQNVVVVIYYRPIAPLGCI